MKRPGAAPTKSAYATVDTYGTAALEIDGEAPLQETLSLAGGISLNRNAYYNATGGVQHVEGLVASWRPALGVEIKPFWNRSDVYDDEFGPTYVPGGAYLPSRRSRREFEGPQQPKYRSTAHLYGVLAEAAPAPDWQVRAGLFRTAFDDRRTATNLLLDLQPDGRADQVLIVAPPSKLAATSGEVRISRRFIDGPRLHVVHLSLRGRDRRDRYGGSDTLDLGPTVAGDPVAPIKGPFDFGPQTFDAVRQWTGGLAYEGRWRGVGEVSLGLQKTDYRKTVDQPGLTRVISTASPWLYSLAGAAYLSERFAVYAGYTRGLEESGVAPENAADRNEALPAIRTRQRDAGVRWTVRPGLKVVAGVFDVRKPYFNLDERQVFAELGDVAHRGIEASLAGKLTPRLDIVGGQGAARLAVDGDRKCPCRYRGHGRAGQCGPAPRRARPPGGVQAHAGARRRARPAVRRRRGRGISRLSSAPAAGAAARRSTLGGGLAAARLRREPAPGGRLDPLRHRRPSPAR